MQKTRQTTGPTARHRWRRLLVGALCLAGCQAPPAPLPPPDPQLIASLVSRGDAAAAQQHWDTPLANSALDYYQRALALDPEQLAARRGLETIVERHLTRARSASERHQHQRANDALTQARQIDPNHAGIAPAAAYLELLRTAKRQELHIDRKPLGNRSSTLGNQLQTLGARARAPQCRALIRAGSDADGRWIYQQLARAPGDRRIRAQFEIGIPAMVALLCND